LKPDVVPEASFLCERELAGVGRPPWRSAGHVTAGEEFVEFAGAVASRLQGMAFLLCGDWHTAEDLVQATLVKVFVSWRRIRAQETAHAYATRTQSAACR
jgi:hypothetical protein